MSSAGTASSNAVLSENKTTGLPKPASFDFLDLRAQFAPIKQEVLEAMTAVMESQFFILGPEVKAFEEESAKYLNAKHAIACASGSDALVLALMALEIGEGDEVITSPFTFIATGGSIARTGAKPVFVDIDPITFNMDMSKLEGAITPKTRAIMPVHLFGLSAEMNAIREIAQKYSLAVIEDAAQAIGARYHEKNVGTIGEMGCFSFFPSKNLGGAGDGGLITTQDDAIADRLKLLRVHGSRKKYHHEILGMNSRLDALQAAILRVKLRHLDNWTEGRRNRVARYKELFESANLMDRVTLPSEPEGFYHVYNQFTIRCTDRDSLREHLRMRGIPTEIYYPIPLHLQPAFAYLGVKAGQLPISEVASQEALSLPVFAELTNENQDLIVENISEFYSANTAASASSV